MADKDGNGKGKRYRPLKYIFLNGELMRVLFISRPRNEIKLWSYASEKAAIYNYSDVRKRMEKAFTLTEVAKMINRHKITIYRAIEAGEIEEPQKVVPLDNPKDPDRFKYMMCEKDIMAMHAVLMTKHHGHPRIDGAIVPLKKTPTARELRAMIRNDTVFYVKTSDGFVPTWQAEQF